MNIKLMRFIDKYGGVLACIVLTVFDNVLKIFKILKNPPAYKFDSILFIKFWGIGSIMLASPTIRVVRRKYPNSRIFFLTFSQNKQICESLELIDEIIVLDPSSFLQFIFDTIRVVIYLRKLKLDLVVDLEFLARFSSIITYLSGAKMAVEFYSTILWRGDFSRIRVNYNYYFHVTENFLNLVSFLGIIEDKIELVKPIVNTIAKDRVDRILRKSGVNIDDILIGVNINSSKMALERRWPKENFAVLVNRVLKEYAVKIVLIGGKEDRVYVDTFVDLIQDKKMVINLTGEINIKELIALLERCLLLISNDSGPLHIAEALDIPTVSFFGPETPILYGPKGDKHLLYYKNLLCSPCMNIHNNKLVNCEMDNKCMTSINADDVYMAIRKKYEYIFVKSCNLDHEDTSYRSANYTFKR